MPQLLAPFAPVYGYAGPAYWGGWAAWEPMYVPYFTWMHGDPFLYRTWRRRLAGVPALAIWEREDLLYDELSDYYGSSRSERELRKMVDQLLQTQQSLDKEKIDTNKSRLEGKRSSSPPRQIAQVSQQQREIYANEYRQYHEGQRDGLPRDFERVLREIKKGDRDEKVYKYFENLSKSRDDTRSPDAFAAQGERRERQDHRASSRDQNESAHHFATDHQQQYPKSQDPRPGQIDSSPLERQMNNLIMREQQKYGQPGVGRSSQYHDSTPQQQYRQHQPVEGDQRAPAGDQYQQQYPTHQYLPQPVNNAAQQPNPIPQYTHQYEQRPLAQVGQQSSNPHYLPQNQAQTMQQSLAQAGPSSYKSDYQLRAPAQAGPSSYQADHHSPNPARSEQRQPAQPSSSRYQDQPQELVAQKPGQMMQQFEQNPNTQSVTQQRWSRSADGRYVEMSERTVTMRAMDPDGTHTSQAASAAPSNYKQGRQARLALEGKREMLMLPAPDSSGEHADTNQLQLVRRDAAVGQVVLRGDGRETKTDPVTGKTMVKMSRAEKREREERRRKR